MVGHGVAPEVTQKRRRQLFKANARGSAASERGKGRQQNGGLRLGFGITMPLVMVANVLLVFLYSELHPIQQEDLRLSLEQNWVELYPNTETLAGLLPARAIDNQIVLTVAASTFLNLTMNLVCSLERIGITNFVVGALDEASYVALKSRNSPVFRAFEGSVLGRNELESSASRGRPENSHKVNTVVYDMLLQSLQEGYEAIVCEADFIFMNNPLRSLRTSSREYDVAAQAGGNNGDNQYCLNSGFVYAKPTQASLRAFAMLVYILSQDFRNGDQRELHQILCPASQRTSGTSCFDPHSNASTLILPRASYAKIHTFEKEFKATKNSLRTQDVYILHYSGGFPGQKVIAMKKHGFWNLDNDLGCLM